MAMKRILVTGGNKGIGKAICQRLVKEYDDTYVLLAARDAGRGQAAIDDICRDVARSGGATTIKDRLRLLIMDTSSTESVQRAAASLPADTKLYGIINNAGIGFGQTMKDVVNTNYFGPRRVNEFFGPFLSSATTSRIVNVSSAAGPGYVANLSQSHPHRRALGSPWTMDHGIAALDQMALDMIRTKPSAEGYGFSKALLNAYTWILAKQYDNAASASTHRVLVNAVSPGFIDTDITALMSGGKKPPAAGAVPPCFLLMDDASILTVPTGRYYGSDCIRSPLSYYRDPGEPPYDAHDDVVDLPPGATAAPPSMASMTTE